MSLEQWIERLDAEIQYRAVEMEYAVALLRAARPYLESMIGVASGMRSLLPDVDEFLRHHRCDYDPTVMTGAPIGMYHCPKCREMVVAGLPHPFEEE